MKPAQEVTPAGADAEVKGPRCRFCKHPLTHVVVDLGMSPLCESYVTAEDLNAEERFYPLVVFVCDNCWLVQLDQYVSPEEIFTEYAYFSSYADSWVEHARQYTEMITQRLGLNAKSFVVEVASNDGYLLQHFVERGIPVLGVEPAANVAGAAIDKGVPTEVSFFGAETARRLVQFHNHADLIIGNNVLAQVPDTNDFVAGLKILLKPDGVITMEFPHLRCLMEENQFDTIYHEHFCYFSLVSVERILAAHGLKLFDVDRIPTHGGSLRVYACHEADKRKVSDAVERLRTLELDEGFETLERYRSFEQQVIATKRKLLSFLISAKEDGKTIVGYGAPGKGNTLLNYCGIRTDFIDYTVDRNPYKQG
ncbi:MAG: class I SAM-dependent methyltransferase, partial [Candidatus Zixiibacteriota bacterium]